jgi:DNA invertase Pin-like site-specific DNA recombinase
LARSHYDDGGYSGGSMDRPALQRLLADVEARRIDVIVVYKVDRLTRPEHFARPALLMANRLTFERPSNLALCSDAARPARLVQGDATLT